MKPVEFALAARRELDDAADYYERDHRGRGVRFYDAIERALIAISATPSAGHPYPGLPEELGVRRWVVRGFPFVLAYRTRGAVIRIEAVVHQKRRPGYFSRRLRR